MKVLLLTRYDRRGASSRLRTLQYLPYLESRGFEITLAPLLEARYIEGIYSGSINWWSVASGYFSRIGALMGSRNYDLLWVEKEIYPWLPAWSESLLRSSRIPMVVDYDDAVFHRYDLHPSAVVRKVLGEKIDAIMRHSSLVIVGSDYLAERARRAGAGWIEEIPTVIDLERYPDRASSGNRTFTVGWIGNPTNAWYVKEIRAVLRRLADTGILRVMLIGAGRTVLTGIELDIREWSEETEVADIQEMDVGIMPLPDEPFERGKCGYKLIQYMACGKPVVASPIGANKAIVENNVNGFLASSESEWFAALNQLREDRILRHHLGAAGRALVESNYCLQVTASRLEALLRQAADSKR